MAAKKGKKASSKGKRYSSAEKRKILDFVHAVNAKKGRGGQSAASKKFRVSQITIGSWLKADGSKPQKKAAKRRGRPIGRPAGTGSRSKAIQELAKLDLAISVKRKELDALESKFASLMTRIKSA